MTFEMLKHFVETVKTGSANKAANKLYISQPAVSGSLKRLEKELGFELFERQKRGKKLSLSKKGQMFYEDAVKILEMQEKWKDASQEIEGYSGNIHIGVIPSIYFHGLNKFVMNMHEKNPRLNIFLHEEKTHKILKKLYSHDESIIVGSFLKAEEDYFKYYVKKNKLNYEKLFDDEFYLFINADNPLAKKEYINKNDLTNLKVAAYVDDDDTTVSATYLNLFRKENRFYWSNLDRILDAVAHDEVVTVNSKVLSMHNVYVQNGKITLRKIIGFYVPHTYYILSHGNDELDDATRMVLNEVKNFLLKTFKI